MLKYCKDLDDFDSTARPGLTGQLRLAALEDMEVSHREEGKDLDVVIGLGGLAVDDVAGVQCSKVEIVEDGEVVDPVVAYGGGDAAYGEVSANIAFFKKKFKNKSFARDNRKYEGKRY